MKSVENTNTSRSAVLVYLEEQSALLRSGRFWNCLAAAQGLSALLLAEGRSPWVARMRKTEIIADQVFHAPLIPRGWGIAATWTTHYVSCCDGLAYDPVAGKPIAIETYSVEIFGEQILLEVFIRADELPAYLRQNLRPRVS